MALLTERRYTAAVAAEGDWYLGNILRDDQLLQSALARHGISSVRIDGASPDVDWSQFRCAVFRTTWDDFERRHEFTAWLNHIRGKTQLCNDAALISWNMDKHYLADLEAKGIPIVPSKFIERGSSATLHELLDESGWDEAIIKPCISGAARHTYRLNRESAEIGSVVAAMTRDPQSRFERNLGTGVRWAQVPGDRGVSQLGVGGVVGAHGWEIRAVKRSRIQIG